MDASKRKQQEQGGISRSLLLSTYLEEFMWGQEFGNMPFKGGCPHPNIP